MPPTLHAIAQTAIVWPSGAGDGDDGGCGDDIVTSDSIDESDSDAPTDTRGAQIDDVPALGCGETGCVTLTQVVGVRFTFCAQTTDTNLGLTVVIFERGRG